MPTYIYKCKECQNVQEEIHSYCLASNDENDYKNNLACNNCKKVGTMFRRIADINFQASSIMTSEQKRSMLKKRSHDHFEKNIKEKFHELNRKKTV